MSSLSPIVFNSINLDTIRTNIPKSNLKKIEKINNSLNNKNTLFQSINKDKNLSNQIQRKSYKKAPKTNKVTSIKLLKLNNNNHTNSFLIAKTPQTLNIQSNYKKCELSANGLYQTNPTTKDTYKKLYHIFKNKRLSTIDLCIDLKAKTPQIETLIQYCKSKYICLYKNSIYLNKPNLKGIQRIIIYDKAIKEGLKTQWLRVEFTCIVDTKLKDFTPPYNEIYDFIDTIFDQSFTIESYTKQIKLLTDGRSYNKRTLHKAQKGIYEKLETSITKSGPTRKNETAKLESTKNEHLNTDNIEVETQKETPLTHEDYIKLRDKKIAKVKALAKEFKRQDEEDRLNRPKQDYKDNQITDDKPPNFNDLYISNINYNLLE